MNAEDRYDSLFQWYAPQVGLDWRLLKAQAVEESAMSPTALNQISGAAGLTQFLQSTFQEVTQRAGRLSPPMMVTSRMNAEHAIRAQAVYMIELVNQFGGDLRKALAAYNWGPGHVANAGTDWLTVSPQETQKYVAEIAARVETYGGTMGGIA